MNGAGFLLWILLMPATVGHVLSATTPDDLAYEIRPSHWNSNHAVTLNVSASEISGLFSNANGISFGLSNSSITASYTVPSTAGFLTTAMASNRGSDFVQATAAFNGTNASGTIASNAISVSVGNYITTAMASNRASDFVQGTAAFAGTNASGTIASGGISVSVGPYITTADLSANSSKYLQEWALLGANTAGTTSSAQGTRLQLSAGNSLTLSGNSNTIVLSVGPYITTGALSGDTSKYVQNWKLTGNTAGTTSSAQGTDLWFSGGNSITVSGNSNTIVLSVGNYITTAMASNRATDFVAATAAFAGTSASGTINSTGISVSIGPYLTTAMASNRATDFVAATAAFAGTNASGTINSTGISVSVAAPPTAASYFDNLVFIQGTTTMSVQGSTSHIAPFMLPYDISISYLRLMVSANFPGTATIATTNAATGSCSIASTIFAVVYVQNTGASSQSLVSKASGSVGFTQRWSLSANATAGSQWTLSKTMSFQNTTGATSFTTQSVASTSNVNLNSGDLTVMTGMKAMEIPFATSLAAGNYWMMLGISSSSATGGSGTLTQLNMSISNIGISQSGFALGHWGNNTNASVNIMPGLGSFSTNAIGTTASLGYSNISSSAANNLPWWQFHRTT